MLRIKNPRIKPRSGSIKQTKELINGYKEVAGKKQKFLWLNLWNWLILVSVKGNKSNRSKLSPNGVKWAPMQMVG